VHLVWSIKKRLSVSDFPTELKYAETHEWVRLEDDTTAVVGITDHAQDALGDIVYVELPEVGANAESGAEVAVVESVKAASDIYSPISGEIVEINSALEDQPETVNHSPYADGWLFKVKLDDPQEIQSLMDAEDYKSMIDAS
jgi:glycine cleavage system H protein